MDTTFTVREFCAEVLRNLTNGLWLDDSPQYKRGEPFKQLNPSAHLPNECVIDIPVEDMSNAAFYRNGEALLAEGRRVADQIEAKIRERGAPIGKTQRKFSGEQGIVSVEIDGWLVAARFNSNTCSVVVVFPFVTERH